MKNTLSLLTGLLLTACYSPNRNCTDFATGTFEFEYEIDGNTKKATFKRDLKYSVDYFDNQIDSSTVRWLNDCEFVLTPLDGKQTAIHYKILSTTSDSYLFEYKRAVKQAHKKQLVKRGTATKID
ncbi:hypothetical protein B7P33_12025 [Sediminicola luteus]|uniref:DNA topoisomerase IV n=1 Tax=Sediminicola luteus TaxID=319238 RepID=A0A2A4G888_9FLAO|nr:hypothetical protein B7P33_12025 [Sediminicola luteus]